MSNHEPGAAPVNHPHYAPQPHQQSPFQQTPQAQYQAATQMPPVYQQPTPHQPGPATAPRGRLNVLGIVALAMLIISTLFAAIQPALFAMLGSSGNYATVATVIQFIQIGYNFVVLCLSIAGVLQKNAPRMRWTAIGSLVAAALSVLTMFGVMIGAWAASLIYMNM